MNHDGSPRGVIRRNWNRIRRTYAGVAVIMRRTQSVGARIMAVVLQGKYFPECLLECGMRSARDRMRRPLSVAGDTTESLTESARQYVMSVMDENFHRCLPDRARGSAFAVSLNKSVGLVNRHRKPNCRTIGYTAVPICHKHRRQLSCEVGRPGSLPTAVDTDPLSRVQLAGQYAGHLSGQYYGTDRLATVSDNVSVRERRR